MMETDPFPPWWEDKRQQKHELQQKRFWFAIKKLAVTHWKINPDRLWGLQLWRFTRPRWTN